MRNVDFVAEELQKIKSKGLYREIFYLEAAQGPYTLIDGAKLLLLSSNNYLGLCSDQRLKNAAVEAIGRYGVGAGGSRLTTGSYRLHQELESQLAVFKGTEACLVFNTGYMANLGTIAGVAGPDWTVFCDRLNHASIIDGCRLSGARLIVYRHGDPADLMKKVRRYRSGHNLLVTDGVFSMDGDLAPLPDLVALARAEGLLLMVDDAHATGVLGAGGRGTAEYYGLAPGAVQLQMGTLSKALASEGGFVAGAREWIDYLRHRAKSFIYSTALAPQTVAVALQALAIVRTEPERRARLLAQASWFRAELRRIGFAVPEGVTPIIPLMVGEAQLAVEFSLQLRAAGIYLPAIRPPTVPAGTSRLRISLMATHTAADLGSALEKLRAVGRRLGLIDN